MSYLVFFESLLFQKTTFKQTLFALLQFQKLLVQIYLFVLCCQDLDYFVVVGSFQFL